MSEFFFLSPTSLLSFYPLSLSLTSLLSFCPLPALTPSLSLFFTKSPKSQPTHLSFSPFFKTPILIFFTPLYLLSVPLSLLFHVNFFLVHFLPFSFYPHTDQFIPFLSSISFTLSNPQITQMGKRKLDERSPKETSPRRRLPREIKGKGKATETPSKRPTTTISSSSSEDTPIRSVRYKTVGKKKKIPTEKVTFLGNPSLQFRDEEHATRFKGLEDKKIVCGRNIDWKSFETSDLYASLITIFEERKWTKLANFGEDRFSEVLVKEFYASLPSVIDKSKRHQENDLHCFVNGIEVTVTAEELGSFLSTEFVSSELRRPSTFDAEQVWKDFADSSQTFAQNPASSLFKIASFKVLHAFIDVTILGNQGSHNSVSKDELWIMEQAMERVPINTAQIILDKIKTVGSNAKFVLPYGNIITSYFKSKKLWNNRYERSLKKSDRSPLKASTLLGKLFNLQGKQWEKKAPTAGGKSKDSSSDEEDSERNEPAAKQSTEVLLQRSIVDLFSKIELSIQNLRIEINKKFDLQDAKLDTLAAMVKQVMEHTSGSDKTHSKQNLDGAGDLGAVQRAGNSQMKQTLEHLSEAASKLKPQTDQPSTQTSPDPPTDDLLFMFPSK